MTSVDVPVQTSIPHYKTMESFRIANDQLQSQCQMIYSQLQSEKERHDETRRKLTEHLDEMKTERNTYYTLLVHLATTEKDLGIECPECFGTTFNINHLKHELDRAKIQYFYEFEYDRFNENCPDDCGNEHCFGGRELKA